LTGAKKLGGEFLILGQPYGSGLNLPGHLAKILNDRYRPITVLQKSLSQD